jgi:traG/traD family protein
MGNCDTHVFLGSNSFKTVEYFSKQLGEKTIDRDNISINKDKQNHRTGKSLSDQIMARALMTPDELRRLDNNLCIIFEKGLKPVKAKKFYYFKHPMDKEMQRYAISHNDIGEIDRGTWRKYNPYNPYVEEDEEEKIENLNIESLDDLFEDEDKKESVPVIKNDTSVNKEDTETLDSLLNPNVDADAPLLPQDEDEDTYDLQKELEAKFDELFGPLDDDE